MTEALTKRSKEILLDAMTKKANYLASKSRIHEREVYDLVREFFKEYLDLKYQFTCDELLIEIGKIYMDSALKVRVREFVKNISHIEYLDRGLSHQELKAQVDTFLDLLHALIPIHHNARHPWHRRLHHWLSGKTYSDAAEDAVSTTLQVPPSQSTNNAASIVSLTGAATSLPSDNIVGTAKIEAGIDEVAHHLANREHEEAQAAYAELKAKYDVLPPDEQALYYDQVQFLYEELHMPLTHTALTKASASVQPKEETHPSASTPPPQILEAKEIFEKLDAPEYSWEGPVKSMSEATNSLKSNHNKAAKSAATQKAATEWAQYEESSR